ncbi:MAG: hypothetical protein AB7F32_02310 [Victivallaceae bacterium]
MLNPVDSSLTSQRMIYPGVSKKRIAAKAVKDGFALLGKKQLPEAMNEFNRAWRFDPDHYASWWGAGIVRGMQAEPEADQDRRCQYIADSVKLLEKTVELAPIQEKINAKCDLIQSYSLCGKQFQSVGKSAEADSYLAKGKALTDELLKSAPANPRVRYQAAINYFYRADFAGALREIGEAERLGAPIDPAFKADVLDKSKAPAK